MDTLKDLNRAMANHLIPGRDKEKFDYICAMRSSVTCMQPSVDLIDEFLALGSYPNSNTIPIIYANRDFLNGIRLAAKDVFAGRVQNLVIFDLDIRLAQCLAKLTNQQINTLSIHWPGHVFLSKMDQVEAGKALHPDAASFHAISLGELTALSRLTETAQPQRPIGTNALRDKASPVIPESADMSDPFWKTAYLTLAEDMVLANAKPKIIERYTGVRHAIVSEMYRSLANKIPPSGPVVQGKGLVYVVNSKRFSYLNIIQYAIFANIYTRLKKLVLEPANRGWLLIHAYRTYLDMIEIDDTETAPSLDVNSAFSMITYVGIDSGDSYGDLALSKCPFCNIQYLVLTSSEVTDQMCPICSYDELMQGSNKSSPKEDHIQKVG